MKRPFYWLFICAIGLISAQVGRNIGSWTASDKEAPSSAAASGTMGRLADHTSKTNMIDALNEAHNEQRRQEFEAAKLEVQMKEMQLRPLTPPSAGGEPIINSLGTPK